METQAMQCARAVIQTAVIPGASAAALAAPETDFLMTVRTTTPSETFTIPCQNVGTFNATVDWGDGSADSTITAYNDADLAHTYATAGDYQIRVSGTFPNIYFNNGGDKLKVISVDNLGSVGWTRLNNSFLACTNMTSFVAGDCDTSLVSNMANMFYACSSLTTLNVSGFNTSLVTNMGSMFRSCTALASDPGLVGFNVASIVTAIAMCQSSNAMLSTAEYDAILIAWAAQTVNSGVAAHFGDATYSAGAAATARAALVTAGWTITDGGPA